MTKFSVSESVTTAARSVPLTVTVEGEPKSLPVTVTILPPIIFDGTLWIWGKPCTVMVGLVGAISPLLVKVRA